MKLRIEIQKIRLNITSNIHQNLVEEIESNDDDDYVNLTSITR